MGVKPANHLCYQMISEMMVLITLPRILRIWNQKVAEDPIKRHAGYQQNSMTNA